MNGHFRVMTVFSVRGRVVFFRKVRGKCLSFVYGNTGIQNQKKRSSPPTVMNPTKP